MSVLVYHFSNGRSMELKKVFAERPFLATQYIYFLYVFHLTIKSDRRRWTEQTSKAFSLPLMLEILSMVLVLVAMLKCQSALMLNMRLGLLKSEAESR
jgi:hypothetical protein